MTVTQTDQSRLTCESYFDILGVSRVKIIDEQIAL